jgi:hypothetical protein
MLFLQRRNDAKFLLLTFDFLIFTRLVFLLSSERDDEVSDLVYGRGTAQQAMIRELKLGT